MKFFETVFTSLFQLLFVNRSMIEDRLERHNVLAMGFLAARGREGGREEGRDILYSIVQKWIFVPNIFEIVFITM